jgi:hypothetical protein
MTGDKAKPTIKITLGGKERELCLDFNAMIAFKRATGKSFLKGDVNLEALDEEGLLALLWAMLLYDDPALTLQQLGHMMDSPATMRQMAVSLAEAVKLAMPEAQAADRPLATGPQAG